MEYMGPMGLVNKLQRHDGLPDHLVGWLRWNNQLKVFSPREIDSNFQLFWAARCRLKIPKLKIKQRQWHLFALHTNMFVPSLECLFASVQWLRFFFLQNFLSNEPILLTQGMSRDQWQLIIANKPNKCLQALFLRQSSEQRRIHDAVFQSNEEVSVFGGWCAFKSQRFTQQKQERISWVHVFLCGDHFRKKKHQQT